jgi:putative resolvase
MKLSEWAKRQGVTYKAAWNWFHAGILPVPARQLPTGTILVDEATQEPGQVAIYARVSSHDQKADLDRQVARLASFAIEHDLWVSRVVTEVGSGLRRQAT